MKLPAIYLTSNISLNMKKILFAFILFSTFHPLYSQQKSSLTVEKIMRDPKWMGVSPANLQWDPNSRVVYFTWNPDQSATNDLYSISLNDHTPVRSSLENKKLLDRGNLVYNKDRSKFVFERAGDLVLYTVKNNKETQLTQTVDRESNPVFNLAENKIIFQRGDNLYCPVTNNKTRSG